jgi:hypothetical protein
MVQCSLGIVVTHRFYFDIPNGLAFSNTGYWVGFVKALNTAVEKWLILYIPIFNKELAL